MRINNLQMNRVSGLHVPQIIVTPDRELQTIKINVDSASSSETADEADNNNYDARNENLRCFGKVFFFFFLDSIYFLTSRVNLKLKYFIYSDSNEEIFISYKILNLQ